MMPESQPEPPKPVGPMIQFVINGDGTSISYAHQSAAGSGTNGIGRGPVTATSADGSVTNRLATQADQNPVPAHAEDRPAKKPWRARLRERDTIVALATIVGTIAAICTWIGWTP